MYSSLDDMADPTKISPENYIKIQKKHFKGFKKRVFS
jgi:hypothetical protein